MYYQQVISRPSIEQARRPHQGGECAGHQERAGTNLKFTRDDTEAVDYSMSLLKGLKYLVGLIDIGNCNNRY